MHMNAAFAGSDYVPVAERERVVFSAGSKSGAMQCIDITIIGDSAVEGNETFIVLFSTPKGVDLWTTVIIRDGES